MLPMKGCSLGYVFHLLPCTSSKIIMGLCDDLVLKNDPPNKDFPISLVCHPVKQSLKKQLSLQAHHHWHCAGRSSGSTQLAACRESKEVQGKLQEQHLSPAVCNYTMRGQAPQNTLAVFFAGSVIGRVESGHYPFL